MATGKEEEDDDDDEEEEEEEKGGGQRRRGTERERGRLEGAAIPVKSQCLRSLGAPNPVISLGFLGFLGQESQNPCDFIVIFGIFNPPVLGSLVVVCFFLWG